MLFRSSLLNDTEWGSLFATEGFVDLGPKNRTFHVTMIHQLHCLDIIRVGYLSKGGHWTHHVEHCLRYLLQGVLCAADTTLEQDVPAFIDGQWVHGGSGIGKVHRCRDWTKVYDYMLRHPAHKILSDPYVG